MAAELLLLKAPFVLEHQWPQQVETNEQWLGGHPSTVVQAHEMGRTLTRVGFNFYHKPWV
jgi:hypothetical protein